MFGSEHREMRRSSSLHAAALRVFGGCDELKFSGMVAYGLMYGHVTNLSTCRVNVTSKKWSNSATLSCRYFG